MRDEVYKQFSTGVRKIVKECMVDKQTANSDSKKYGHFDLLHAKQIFYFDREKVKACKSELKSLIKMVPHAQSRRGLVFTDLLPDTILENIDSVNPRALLQASNMVETFFGLACYNSLLILHEDPKTNHVIVGEIPVVLRPELRSTYRKAPSFDEK